MRAYARFLENLLHILCNLLCGEVIVLQYLVYVIAVEELLLETKVQYLNVGITVKTRDLLSKAGTIIYLNRPFEDCYKSLMRNPDRPLIKNNTKEELLDRYNKRAVSYEAYAAFTVKNDRTPQATARHIIELLF